VRHLFLKFIQGNHIRHPTHFLMEVPHIQGLAEQFFVDQTHLRGGKPLRQQVEHDGWIPHNNFPDLPYSLIKYLVMVEGQFAHLLEGHPHRLYGLGMKA